MNTAMKKKLATWGAVILVSLGSHILTLLLCQVLIQGGFSFAGLSSLIHDRLTQPGDAVRYLDLAQNGYVASGENAINLVFYPLYPLLVRALSFLTFGNLPLAGLILSQTAYSAASVVLYETLCLDRPKKDAWFGVLFMAFQPFSVFVMGVYTEGLFLLLTITCLFFLRKQRYLSAGAAGFLAALCRTQGVLLLFPAVYELVVRRFGKEKRRFQLQDAGVLLIPAGFCVYLAINYALHGNPFQFLLYEADEPWYQTSEWISRNIALQFSMGREYKGLEWIIYYPQIILYFFGLAALFFGLFNKERVSEILYGGAYLGFTYLSGWMISGGRYMLGCVPVFIVLCGVKNEALKAFLLFASALFCFAYSLFFYMSFSIM